MFPVLYKDRISHTESYPVGAQEVSDALSETPQAEFLGIVFCRYDSVRCFGAWCTDWRIVKSRGKCRPIFRAAYSRRKVSISTPNLTIARGDTLPKWELWVWSVPRQQRHKVHTLLFGEGLQQVKNWLTVHQGMHGEFKVERLTVLFDEEKEGLLYE